MSFARSFEEAHAIQMSIQREKTDGHSGESSSPILHGSSTPGTTEKVSNSHTMVDSSNGHGEMVPHRTKIKVRTTSLERKYASTGS